MTTHDFVRSIVTHPDVWPHLAEDINRPEDYQPSDTNYYRHGDAGYMQFDKVGAHWYQVHIAMLRGAKGVREFVLDSMADMRAKGARRFMAMIAATNRSAIILAYRCGYRFVGKLDGVLLKQGKPTDMIILEAQ